MAVTSFIKPITTRKGIFYSFQSANDDLTLTFNNSVNKARFTHFALLRLPDIGVPTALYGNKLVPNNSVQFLAPGETPLIEGLNTDQNINLAESFQNYALNFEALLLSLDSHDRSLKQKVSERIFWKWLKELGAIHWRDANALERNANALSSDALRFTEMDENATIYNRVVKYIGEIDVVNSVKTKDNAYSEIYIYVPTNVGTTPHVLFKTVDDVNYTPNMIVTNNPADPLDIEFLSGRHYSDVHPYGLNTNGFFDLDDASVTSQIAEMPTSNAMPPSYSTGRWFNGTINNSYYTDSDFSLAKNQLIKKTKNSVTIDYVRNTLDGVVIDFDLANYKLASENPSIKTFSSFNDYVANKNFEFNVVLLYYEVFDPNNPTDSALNLHGVLFLNKVEQNGLEFRIPYITKNRPDVVTKVNGDAFAFKVNVKTDNSVEDVRVERSINDFSTFSLDLFTDLLTVYRNLSTSFNDKLLELETLKGELQSAKDSILNTSFINGMQQRLSTLENSLQNSQNLFDNSNAFSKLLEKISSDLNNFIEGNTSVEVSYNSDVIKSGDGVRIERKPNRVTVHNDNQTFNISNNSIYDLEFFRTLPLSKFANYYRHEKGGNSFVSPSDITLKIDDSSVTWKKGQTFDLVFSDPIDLGSNDITIVTDANNLLGNGTYGKTITVLSQSDFGTDMTPIFRLTCIDQVGLNFRVDKLR